MSVFVQAVPRPATWEEFEAIKPQLIDTLGSPLISEFCSRCRCNHFTVEPHLDEVPCPDCGSTAARCRRGSEHEASEWHKARREAFDRLRDELEAAGIPQVARWAEPAAGVQTGEEPLDPWARSEGRQP